MAAGKPQTILTYQQVGENAAIKTVEALLDLKQCFPEEELTTNAKGPGMALPTELRKYRKQLTGMILELQTNQATLKELLDWFGVFAFTGGDVPRGRYSLVGITSYLHRPFATNRVSTGEVERYGHLVGAIVELGQAVAAGPRTLPRRHDMADAFGRVASEIQTLGSTLESALAKVLKEQE